MHQRRPSWRYTAALALLLPVVLCGPAAAQGYTYKVIHNFCNNNPNDGYAPGSGLISDGEGNLYGTTYWGGFQCGGHNGFGIVFELSPNADGTWREAILHSFSDLSNGTNPVPPLVMDRGGNLYGMTTGSFGGPYSYGSVFELSRASDGSWRLRTLHGFTGGADGGFDPNYTYGALLFANSGQLLGNTSAGGIYNHGVLFDLGSITVLHWYEFVAHAFAGGLDGSVPQGPLVMDRSGNIYGTTFLGGSNNAGTVFKLTPNRGSFGWTETVLYSFGAGGQDGMNPYSGVIFDAEGDLVGTTQSGGAGGAGTVFQLTPNQDGTWSESVLYSFSDPDGAPSGLSQDNLGNLYGIAGGGPYGYGIVYKLSRSGGQWTLTTLYAFTGREDGGIPNGALLLDAAGNIFGVAEEGGLGGFETGGVAFELSPAH